MHMHIKETHTHFRGPGLLLIKCMPSSVNTERCKTEDKSAAIDATLRLLQLTCNIQDELTKRHIICIKIEIHPMGMSKKKVPVFYLKKTTQATKDVKYENYGKIRRFTSEQG